MRASYESAPLIGTDIYVRHPHNHFAIDTFKNIVSIIAHALWQRRHTSKGAASFACWLETWQPNATLTHNASLLN